MNKYKEALQKIANKDGYPLAETINGLKVQVRWLIDIATEALQTEERKQHIIDIMEADEKNDLYKEQPNDWKKHFIIDDEKSLEAYMKWRKSPKTYTQEEMDNLIEQNKYLIAEFEANKNKIFTQEEMDEAKALAYGEGYLEGVYDGENK